MTRCYSYNRTSRLRLRLLHYAILVFHLTTRRTTIHGYVISPFINGIDSSTRHHHNLGRIQQDERQFRTTSLITTKLSSCRLQQQQRRRQRAFFRSNRSYLTVCHNAAASSTGGSSSNNGGDKEDDAIKAEDGEALQLLFAKECDEDGLMSKEGLMKIPIIAQLLADEDILMEEFDEFWNSAPKFPDADSPSIDDERIDVDSFIQIYRDIDDLFEDDDNEDEKDKEKKAEVKMAETSPTTAEESDGSSAAGAKSTNSSTDATDKKTTKKDSAVGSESKVTMEMGGSSVVTVETELEDDVLEAIFDRACDDDGLMTKEALAKVPIIAQMLAEEDLLSEELDDIWSTAPKFPEVNTIGTDASSSPRPERIDVDSFIQIYRDIDDLFEEEDDDDDDTDAEGNNSKDKATTKTSSTTVSPPTESSINGAPSSSDDDDDDEELEKEEHELELTFETICDDGGLISKQSLKDWNEVQQLLTDGMLSAEEFEELWERTRKSPGSMECLDVDGFLSFNVALDDLFVFDDDEEEEGETGDNETPSPVTTSEEDDDDDDDPRAMMPMVTETDLPPAVIFSQLCGTTLSLLSYDDLRRWGELTELISDGELTEGELRDLYDAAPKALGTTDRLDEEGFVSLYEAIDEMFEEVDEEEEEGGGVPVKEELLKVLTELNDVDVTSDDDDEEAGLPCGLDCTDEEQAKILQLVSSLEVESSNMISSTMVNEKLLSGTWELLYTSSSMMKFNKGLSGLGGSFPNGKFSGLRQTLKGDRYMTDCEYTEYINVANNPTSSFEVSITGPWEIKNTVSLLTGRPTILIAVEPDTVKYGPTNTRADHWKSVRSMNLLDVSYLDEDLRVMRGNTSTDTIFVFRRI